MRGKTETRAKVTPANERSYEQNSCNISPLKQKKINYLFLIMRSYCYCFLSKLMVSKSFSSLVRFCLIPRLTQGNEKLNVVGEFFFDVAQDPTRCRPLQRLRNIV